jgi:hypothetical protein
LAFAGGMGCPQLAEGGQDGQGNGFLVSQDGHFF